jgi:hypothetical protein
MDGLSTEILGHSQLRTVPCCLCGVSWEERLVGVALVAGLAVLGDLCPRCLSREPADASARLKARLACDLGEGSADPLAPFLERLCHMGQWGTTVEQAIKAERLYFLRRFGPLDDLLLRRAVDYRYRDFLAASD